MSYILDAIRKAEQERKDTQPAPQYSVQASSRQPEAGKPDKNHWYLAGGLALIGLNIGLWLLYSAAGANGIMEAGTGVPIVSVASPAVVAEPAQTLTPDTSSTKQDPQMPADATVPEPQVAMSRVKIWQASAAAQTAVNALAFSFHVYSESPAKRTIIINGQRVREGDLISAELRLAEITESGVLLRFNDTLLEVEVLQQW